MRASVLAMLGVLVCLAVAPVQDHSRKLDETPYRKADSPYVVQKGDTLYSIAWREGVGVDALRRWNGLSGDSDTIVVGQKIRLGDMNSPALKGRVNAIPAVGVAAPAPKTKSKPKTAPRKTATQAKTSKGKKPSKAKSKIKRKKGKSAQGTGAVVVAAGEEIDSKPSSGSTKVKWNWPIRASLGRGYEPSKLHKGIDFIAARGSPVKTAAAGKVRHAGTNVPGYGNLVLIEHAGKYISAYAHLDEIRVLRGAIVEAGDVIGTLGSSGTDRAHLHFEIRQRHRSVNPMQLLP